MIELGCDKCGQLLHLKDEMAGRKGRCPRCGTSLTIPGGSRMSATPSLLVGDSGLGGLLPPNEAAAPQGADDAGAHKGQSKANRRLSTTPTGESSRLHPAAIVAISVAILVVGGALTWTFAFRDTWQRDNYSAISAMGLDANALSVKGKLRESFEKYKELEVFVKGRNITDPGLKLLIADADKDKERIQKLLQKALNREQAEKMETQATKLAGEAKLTEAKAAYEQLEAFLSTNEFDNAFRGAISERLAKQRKDMEAKIASKQKEPSRDKPTSSRPAQSQPASRPEFAPLSPEQVFEKASPAVVYIIVRDKDFKPIGLGSGFFVTANGLVVTNYHVIKGAEFATARLSSGATLFVDGVVATDPSRDLALLKVSGGGFPCLKIAKGALLKVGATVYAIGNPQGLENTFSGGMVSGHREIKQGLTAIQVTTPISPGSSGGPLLNVSGEVVGVTTGGLTGGQNLNFAAPVSGVSALIRKQGKVRTLASAGGGRFDSTETEELDKAWAAMGKKDWGTAAKILTALREKQKDNPVVWFALGRLHYELGNQEIAIQHYETAIVLKSDYAIAYCGMGYAYCKLKLYPQAVEVYKKAIAIDPGDAWAYCGMGIAYDELKRYPEAIEAYKKAVVVDPNFAGGYVLMGKTYCELKRYAEAVEAYKKAIAIKPGDAWAYFWMGRAYCELKRYAEAIEAYEQFLRLEPTGSWPDDVRKDLPRLRRLAGQ